jgi:hypothetical protein
MTGTVAQCESCGCIFDTPDLFKAAPGVTMYFEGLSTLCPLCGGYAKIGDGAYLAGPDGQLDFVAGPPLSVAMANALRSVAQRARQTGAKAEEILAEVADISPELASKLRSRWPLPAFAIILILLWLIKSVELSVTVDLNKLIDQAYHLSEEEGSDAHLDASPINPAFERQTPPPMNSVPNGFPRAILADRQRQPLNRLARRRERALAKRRPKGPPSL